MRYIRRITLFFCLALSFFTVGCKEQKENQEIMNPYAAINSMESAPIVDYIIKEAYPNISVDKSGYSLSNEKCATVKGTFLPETFFVIDAKSDEVIYSGKLEEIQYSEKDKIYYAIADFSELDKEGEYYLECESIGRSYSFLVQDGLYQNMFTKEYEKMMENCQNATLNLRDALAVLQCYEWYSDIFPDENRDAVPDVLKELEGWIDSIENDKSQEIEEVIYAAFLAKFSYLYQKFDYDYATDCLKRASTVYSQQKNLLMKDADHFWALTELYRATGSINYRREIADYLSFFENNQSYLEEPVYLYASMTYMVTRQRVEVDLCKIFMTNLMERAEEISVRYSEMLAPVSAKNNGINDLLKCVMEVSCANYVMNNYQYTQIVEDFLHYLMGRNENSYFYYENQPGHTEYLFLWAQLVKNTSNHEEEEK